MLLTYLAYAFNLLSICFFQQCGPELSGRLRVKEHEFAVNGRQFIVDHHFFPLTAPPHAKPYAKIIIKYKHLKNINA